jgi:hypothetical protein
MDNQTPDQILKNMRSLKRWIQGRMVEIDSVLKMKQDLEYYQHQTAQLMKRVERLERHHEGQSKHHEFQSED